MIIKGVGMRKTAAYYRSSTKLQEESVPAQQYNIHQYALKSGILIDIEYIEPFVSARKNKLGDRSEMRKLMTDIRNRKIDRLLVYKRDRLARKVDEHLELYKLFKKYEVEVHFIAQNEPPMRYDIFGELMELFIGVMNQREGEQINMRIADTKVSNFLNGKSIGKLPYGYFTDERKTKIYQNEEELEIVRKIFSEWNTDQYENTEKLAQKLTKDGIKRKDDKEWSSNNILYALTNPIYMGIRIANFDNRQLSKSVSELAIIDPKEFNLAQELLERRKKPKKEKLYFKYLLSDLIKCDICSNKTPLSPSIRKNQGTYECKEHNITLQQNEIERLIYLKATTFFTDLLNSHFEQLYPKQLNKQLTELKKLKNNFEKELHVAEEKLVEATNKWINQDNRANKEKVLKCSSKVKALKDKIFSLTEKEAKLNEVPGFKNEIKNEFLKQEVWNSLPFERKKLLLNDLIHFIFVEDQSIRIIFKHPYLEAHEVIN